MVDEGLKRRDRQRHFRSVWYASASLALAVLGYLFLGFSPLRASTCCVVAFAALNMVSYRQMFLKGGEEPSRKSTE